VNYRADFGTMAVANRDTIERVLAGGGDAGALARTIDWSATPLGPVDTWSRALQSAASIVLHNHSGMLLWWGRDLVQIYNDAYRPVLGDKHPRAMGQPFRECWREVFGVLGPLAERALRTGEAAVRDDIPLLLDRKLPREEAHFRLAYSPVPDESVPETGVGGVLATVNEISEKVFADRQLGTLRDLASRAAAEPRTVPRACADAAATLAQNPWDLPFVLLFVFEGERPVLAASAGFDAAGQNASDAAAWRWPLAECARERRVVSVDGLDAEGPALPASPWGDRPRRAVMLPLTSPEQPHAYGVLVCGISPHRAFDAGYQTFCELAAGQVDTAIRNARAREEERRRANALAEIDRAKTAFFSNVSHEFRTPLTLILGPLVDALDVGGALAGDDLRAVHRNALRLLRLVNSLLEFSRVEAGRAHVRFQPTDLATVTADVSSAFRSTVEHAGVRFDVRCEALPSPVYVDREKWERIVLNLLSNAFKFTFEGAITVTQRLAGAEVLLEVTDTGVGIPAAELPRVFERFHRVEGSRARTHEGSGIGLALIHEFVALHGGRVSVESAVGRGTTFTIALPLGTRHLPADRIDEATSVATSTGAAAAEPFIAEALRWQPNAPILAPEPASARAETPARVLIVDDNADLREYMTRLLGAHWQVEAVTDGERALAAVREHPPDLVVADVMMPNLDGFGLLRALRATPTTAGVPVLLLSARAGEDARVEGLEAGADDYLVKPFSARELVARVRVLLEQRSLAAALATATREAEEARSRAEAANRAKDEFLAMLGHELRNPLSPIVTAVQLMRYHGVDNRELVVIERQVGHLLRLVDDLLDVARITRGRIELRRMHVELAPLVLRGLEIATPLLEQRRQTVELTVPTRGLEVHADPDRFAQVVSNLLTNASKYSESGTAIVVVAERDGDVVRLRVRDRGIGIPPEMLGRVFDVFYQQPQSLARSEGGLGLGLAIVRSVTELHGGAVTAHSEGPGRGSEFVIELPWSPEAAAATLSDEATDARPDVTRGKRILVVDDNDDLAAGVADLLRELGNNTETAHDGPSALRIATTFKPEVCLLDIGLPAMDGYELARRLRESAHLAAGARLIALTGYGQEADRERSRTAGFDAHLVKPVSIETLTRAIVN
jgi:signal transduction histidine kinase